jgi:hypothetical protein
MPAQRNYWRASQQTSSDDMLSMTAACGGKAIFFVENCVHNQHVLNTPSAWLVYAFSVIPALMLP